MDVRPYREADRAACLQVIESLTPHLTEPGLRPRFEEFLDRPAGRYFVLEHEDAIAGCGGFAISPDGDTATLLWGMIRNDVRKLGLGRFLLLYRIREIGRAGNIRLVRAETPPASAGFFEKQGFRVEAVTADRVELSRKLAVCP
jgi:N-acetylglutamate synthase-like GNAT family acetyltransferase